MNYEPVLSRRVNLLQRISANDLSTQQGVCSFVFRGADRMLRARAMTWSILKGSQAPVSQVRWYQQECGLCPDGSCWSSVDLEHRNGTDELSAFYSAAEKGLYTRLKSTVTTDTDTRFVVEQDSGTQTRCPDLWLVVQRRISKGKRRQKADTLEARLAGQWSLRRDIFSKQGRGGEDDEEEGREPEPQAMISISTSQQGHAPAQRHRHGKPTPLKHHTRMLDSDPGSARMLLLNG